MAMTGKFVSPTHIDSFVVPGENINARLATEVSNPGKTSWTFCVMCDRVSASIPHDKFIVFETKMYSESDSFDRTYNLKAMLNEKITIKLRLLGHDDRSHNWTLADWRD